MVTLVEFIRKKKERSLLALEKCAESNIQSKSGTNQIISIYNANTKSAAFLHENYKSFLNKNKFRPINTTYNHDAL